MPCWLGCEGNSLWKTDEDRDAQRYGAPLDLDAIDRALAEVDLSSCGVGVRGYVMITLMPSGRVGDVVLRQLAPATDAVRACVLRQYYDVHVPAFRGRNYYRGRQF